MRATFNQLALAMVAATVFLASCDDDDVATPLAEPTPAANSVLAKQVTTPPEDDSTLDPLWANARATAIPVEVASYNYTLNGHDIWWNEYEGNKTDVTMKCVYTDTHIYFLFEWDDADDSRLREAWYYHPTGGKWLQMGKQYPDEFGNPPAYEDKFTIFWNISIAEFGEHGCHALCHGSNMSTGRPGETADTWHWKRDRNGPVFELDDQYLDNALNGRHNDAGTGSYSDNVQSVTTTGAGLKVLPKYWIPGRTDYHWIMQSEIDNGTARKIVDMDASGNLIDQDGTVLDRTQFGYDSGFVIPSVVGIKPATGSRGDVDAWYRWESGRWYVKIKRLRDTANADDVQFTKRNTPYQFSIGVMNNASIAHATPGGWDGNAYELILE